MGNTTINGFTLHDGINVIISENDCRKEGSLTILPLYMNDSELTDVFDFGGAVKTINITGVLLATDVADQKSWIEDIESLINGVQDSDHGAPYLFTDDLRGSIYVKVLEFNSTRTEGNPNQISWSIKLAQSSTNS